MIKFFFIFILVVLQSCSKPKAVLICGDHVCVNKNEAKQYFEENLSLEVKIIKDVKYENFDLVQLNLNDNKKKKIISIEKKEKTTKEIKTLSEKQIKRIKENIKKKKLKKRTVQKKQYNQEKKLKVTTSTEPSKKNIIYKENNTTDVCTILEKCSIEEISKYLIKIGKKKDFPNITLRE